MFFMQTTWHKVIIGDSRKMKEIEDSSVHLIVTSPPYWQLKDYGHKEQIGFDDTYEEYINNLNLVWSECYRVLHPGCRLCINIGDQFARAVYYGRYKIIPIRTEIIKFCENIGFDYMGAIIWQKQTTMNTTGGATIMGSFPYPRNGIIKIDYEFILIFKKPGNPPIVTKEQKELSRLTKQEWDYYFSGHWSFNGEKQAEHIAMFPEELPKRLIKMFSFVGDTVLDPFLGSGTTILAAKKLQRNSIGYEINKDFLHLIKKKIGYDESLLIKETDIEITFQEGITCNWKEEINKLPYIFFDPVKFDKKVDPRNLSFGSKIKVFEGKKEDYFTVHSIISPNEIILNNNLKVKLIGVRPIETKIQQSIEFLKKKLNKQKVFIKFDNIKYDNEGKLLVYLYLKNKTFINAHLIKNGLVDIDLESDYSLKNKFIKLKEEQNAKRVDTK